jgi:hypothetical protein
MGASVKSRTSHVSDTRCSPPRGASTRVARFFQCRFDAERCYSPEVTGSTSASTSGSSGAAIVKEKETRMAKFLSDEWFAKVKEITEDAGELEIPGPLKDLTFNLTVSMEDGSEKKVHMNAGQFGQGHKDAPVTILLPGDVARKIFIEQDQQAGMQAFMSGQMRVEGDVTKLMMLQTVPLSDDLKDLMTDIKDITE